jgi:hypothetical protein
MFPLLTGFICSNSRAVGDRATICGGKCEISEAQPSEAMSQNST